MLFKNCLLHLCLRAARSIRSTYSWPPWKPPPWIDSNSYQTEWWACNSPWGSKHREGWRGGGEGLIGACCFIISVFQCFELARLSPSLFELSWLELLLINLTIFLDWSASCIFAISGKYKKNLDCTNLFLAPRLFVIFCSLLLKRTIGWTSN